MIELNCEYLSVGCISLYLLIMSGTRFRVNPHSIFSWCLGTPCSKQTRYLKIKLLQQDSHPQDSTITTNWPNDWAELLLLISTVHLTVCSFHIRYPLQSQSTLYIWLNVKELLPRNRRNISRLSDCNGTRTNNHLVHKPTLKCLAKLTKWLSWFVSTYLSGAFDCMFLSCEVRVSEWIYTLYLPECHGTPSS